MQRPDVLSEAHPEPLLAAMTEEHWEAARLSAVVAEAAQDVPREAAEVPDEPLAVMAEAAQDAPREAAEARDEPLAAALPSAAEPSVAPQALSLLAARLARQRTTLPLRGPEVMTFEGPRPQSLRAGSIEFVSWQPVRKKEST
jgi:hypothetical protein